MAHYAKVNNDGIVETVIVADQSYISTLDESFRWIQTSYNNNFRKNYAGIGYTYDRVRDAFIPPKVLASSKFERNALDKSKSSILMIFSLCLTCVPVISFPTV